MQRLYHHHVCFLHNKRRRKLISSQTDRSCFFLLLLFSQSERLLLHTHPYAGSIKCASTHFEQWPKKTLQMSNRQHSLKHQMSQCHNDLLILLGQTFVIVLVYSSVLISILRACIPFSFTSFSSYDILPSCQRLTSRCE